MTLLQLAVFSLAGILIGFIWPSRLRSRVILAASILAIYWMQPASTIRYLAFWLPTLTLALVLWVYTTCFPLAIRNKNNQVDITILLSTALFIGLLRYMGPLCCLTSTTPPQFLSIIIFLVGIFILAALLTLPNSPKAIIPSLIILILTAFFFLKNEVLATSLSRGLRAITGQNTQLANGFEIIWLGYSYVAFRLLHVLRDKQNGRLNDMELAEFASYVLFFPSFTAGPIDRAQNFVKKLRENLKLDSARFISGTERLAAGIFKKFVLADSLALISLSAQNAPQVNAILWGWVILYAYAFRILLDFSGYTDIAIGIGIYAGIQLPKNFNKPYRNSNLTEFWNNWHMTLTQWFRAYFFNPLTRYFRSSKLKLPLPIIIIIGQFSTMILIGLWHGIAWNFILWGAWHGAGLFIHNRWSTFIKNRGLQPKLTESKSMKYFGIALTFNYVALGWIWFVLPNVNMGWAFIKILFGAS